LRVSGNPPVLYNLPAIVRMAMVMGSATIWAFLIILFYALIFLLHIFFGREVMGSPAPFILLLLNSVLTFVVFALFNRWRNRIFRELYVRTRYGTARFAKPEELQDLTGKKGVYIGGDIYSYFKQGHILTVCKTRGGKGTNLIIPNLLGKGGYQGSIVVIDPKAENIAVTARYQGKIGQHVLALDPWGLHTGEGATFNPLDLLSANPDDDRLSDDADSLAEMIVPFDATAKDQFFNDRARALICGMFIFIAISQTPENRTLTTLWKWLRLSLDELGELLAQMSVCDNAVVRACANEAANIMSATPKTFASILSSAQQFTDFLKSVPLQRSLASSNFSINDLAKEKTSLYIIIPPDLIVTKVSCMRRRPYQ